MARRFSKLEVNPLYRFPVFKLFKIYTKYGMCMCAIHAIVVPAESFGFVVVVPARLREAAMAGSLRYSGIISIDIFNEIYWLRQPKLRRSAGWLGTVKDVRTRIQQFSCQA